MKKMNELAKKAGAKVPLVCLTNNCFLEILCLRTENYLSGLAVSTTQTIRSP
jgi:hypothetical protein